jgi:hypothetical protein
MTRVFGDSVALTALASRLAATSAEFVAISAGLQLAAAAALATSSPTRSPVRVLRGAATVNAVAGSRGLGALAVGYGLLATELAAAARDLAAAATAEVGRTILELTNLGLPYAAIAGLHLADPLLELTDPAIQVLLPEGPGVAMPVAGPAGGRLPAPHSLADAYMRIQQLAPGQVEVIPITGPDGVTRYLVLLRGVEPKPFDSGVNATVNSLQQAAKGSRQSSDAYSRAVLAAMVSAGVPPGAEVMLVGHSQGGITAMNLAADPRVNGTRGLYRVSRVVTAGSPVGNKRVVPGSGTTVLSIENAGDIVPELDAVQDKSGPGRTVITVPARYGLVGGGSLPNHALETGYLPALLGRGFTTDPRIREFSSVTDRYLGPAARPGESHWFRATEGPMAEGPQATMARALGLVILRAI